MREKLKTYIDYLFAGAPQTAATEETKAEILQNTLDKYDDLIAEGKTPEAAYSLAVSGIGDLRDFLTRSAQQSAPASSPVGAVRPCPAWTSSLILAAAIMLYITCVIPVILNGNVVWMFVMVALATGLLVFRSTFLNPNTQKTENRKEEVEPDTPQIRLRKSINGFISAISLVIYLIVSFATMAWHITWVIFPLSAAVQNIIKACFELKD